MVFHKLNLFISEIIMTPSKKGKATCIKIERKKKAENQADEHHHVAGGEHKGLVINKESQGKKFILNHKMPGIGPD